MLRVGFGLLAMLLSIAQPVAAQLQSTFPPQQLSKDSMLLDLMRLTSREFAGRGTGHEGYERAAEMVAGHLTRLGFESFPQPDQAPDNNPYLLAVPYKGERLRSAVLQFSNLSFQLGKDFYPASSLPAGEIQFDELVFGGFAQQDGHFNDLSQLSVQGKWVLVMAGKIDTNNRVVAGEWRQQYRNLVQKGAAGVLLVNPNFKKDQAGVMARLLEERISLAEEADVDGEPKRNATPALMLSPEAAKKLYKVMKVKLRKERRARLKGKKPVVKRATGLSARLFVDKQVRYFSAPNVMGFIRGEERPEEYILLSAHLDHLGEHDGTIYYGADDNGTGSAALLSIARELSRWSAEGVRPRRSIALVWFSGEENGLLGSRWLANHAPMPTDMITTNINVDMIGRTDDKHKAGSKYLYVIGADRLSQELHDVGEEVNQACCQLELDYTYNDPKDPNRYYFRSDHYNFAKQGIPSVFFFSGVHADYHRPTDTLEKIELDRMKYITEYILYHSWELANRENRVKVK